MLAKKSSLQNHRGMAIMELIPIMVILVILINYSLGFFGAIHTGILNQMAARNYAFETFRNRSNLMYFRDTKVDETTNFSQFGSRWHATVSDKAGAFTGKGDFVATERRIDFLQHNEETGSKDVHNNQIGAVASGKRFTANDGVNPIWVRPQYGICLDSKCGKK